MPSAIGGADTNPQASGWPLLAAAVVLLLGLALSVLGTRALAIDRAERERLHLAQQAATQVRQLELALQLAIALPVQLHHVAHDTSAAKRPSQISSAKPALTRP